MMLNNFEKHTEGRARGRRAGGRVGERLSHAGNTRLSLKCTELVKSGHLRVDVSVHGTFKVSAVGTFDPLNVPNI